ncbi:MAG: IS5 family transposase [Rhabdochlamydiaceae bacterium]
MFANPIVKTFEIFSACLLRATWPIKKREESSRKGAEEMKRSQHRMPMTLGRQAYPSDLTDEQWKLLEPLVPAIAPDAAYHVHTRREIVNAILYVLRRGCPWRMLPHEFPAWETVYCYFRRWERDGTWDQVLRTLRMQVRRKQGREPEPSAAVIESQSIKTSAVRGPEKGYDRGKKESCLRGTIRDERGYSVY